MKIPLLPKTLTYLGLVPFVIALLIACYDRFNWAQYFAYEINYAWFKSNGLAHSYGAIIAAFLAGIQWGFSLNQTTDKQYFIASNVLALLAWLSLFAFASATGISTLMACFVLALIIDRHAFKAAAIPAWFWQLRKNVSAAVIVCLLATMLLNRW